MLATKRQSMILHEISMHSAAKISELANLLNVSEMTVRRDLELLAEQGLLEKVHGGAKSISRKSGDIELPFKSKSRREQLAKDAIAARAVAEIAPGSSFALMGGSTVFAVAKLALNIPGINVVTNSLPISDLFEREGLGDQTVVLAGGLRTPTDSFVGDVAVAAFESFNLDAVFMGAHGVDHKSGFSTPNLQESQTNRAVIERARKLVIVADHTKWGESSLSTFAQLEDADLLVMDAGLPEPATEILQTLVKELAIVAT